MNQRAALDDEALPWWLAAIVIVGALLSMAGGLIALLRPEMLLAAGQPMNHAAYLYAGYLISRGLALDVALLTALVLRARRELLGLMLFTALVQFIDAIVDASTGRLALVPVVVILGCAFLIGAMRLVRRRFGKA